LVTFNPKQNCLLGIAGPAIESVGVSCDEDGFSLPEQVHGTVSALLEVDVRASMAGQIADPAIEIEVGEFQDVQYFERGVGGVRFLNVSRLLASDAAWGKRVRLSGRGVIQPVGKAVLHFCREKVCAGDRVLIVAPHPDDAEIAAFGLYADTKATIVTLTAGDASDRYQSSRNPWLDPSRETVARMRVWDSITIPQLGGVPLERSINLCFPDGHLAEMYRHPERDVRDEDTVSYLNALRRLNRSPLIRDTVSCTWTSLVHDLRRIILEIAPTIIVTPHPRLDPNPDHLFTTVAVGEALHPIRTPSRMFFYVVHNHRSELWPFGPAGSGVPLLPILADDGICASGFYSHGLSMERQKQKFVALEAMHDVREMERPDASSRWDAGFRLVRELRASANGLGRVPTSYLRRGVRPDEFFFSSSFAEGWALTRHVLKQKAASIYD
jgi:LmbE family N-acetylglucosaminyl deacetylase